MGPEHNADETAAALQAIASLPPNLPEKTLRDVLWDNYGLEGELRSLVSERDQNCVVTTPAKQRFVLKIANVAEDAVVTDFQICALRHLEAQACRVATPRIVLTRSGQTSVKFRAAGANYTGRVVTYLAGRPITGQVVDDSVAFAIGSALAELDAALAGFAHPGDSQVLLWDMQRTLQIRPLLQHVNDTGLHDSISRCLDEFEASVVPFLQSAERQVIHGDLNPGNVLLAKDDTAVAGIIDFGDMVRAPAVVDLAIAASYFRKGGADPLALLASLVAGYDSVLMLPNEALAVLHCMVRARLATSITLLQWRLQTRDDGDAYSAASAATEDDAAEFLAVLDAIGEQEFRARLRTA